MSLDKSVIVKDFERYSQQINFKKIGVCGQRAIGRASVAVVGLGAIGSVASQLLARAGVRKLMLIDRDTVEFSNLQRQFYPENFVGLPKAIAAARMLKKINSRIKIDVRSMDLKATNVGILRSSDLVLDCVDNMSTRLLINDFCRRENILWVHAAVAGSNGAVMSILPSGPCLRCLYPHVSFRKLETCETIGILNSATSLAASLQTAEAIKILVSKVKRGGKVDGRLVHFDVWSSRFDVVSVTKKPKCKTCSGEYEFLNKTTL